MRRFQIFLFLLCSTVFASERPRLCVLTDIGGDPDDRQSMVRLMVYANEFQIEGLIASASGTPGELKEAVTRPDLIREMVSAYGQVRPNLMRHAEGWPTVDDLTRCIKSGNPQRGLDNIGEGHDSEASRWLVERVDAGTPARPLNIAIWGGQTDLAQALWRVRHDRGATGLAQFVKLFRVYDIDDQDRIADWMRGEFPGLFYILAKAPAGKDRREGVFRGMYLTGDEALTSREWMERHVRACGPLGALYPLKTWTAPNPHGCLKEGDTPSWFFFLPCGGNDPADPSKPGWGGQFRRDVDGWWRDLPADGDFDPRSCVSRWRPDFQSDFARRMSGCLADGAAPAKPVRIVVIGDSTVCEYPESRPDRGWGHFVEERFKTGAVTVINLAAGGRSTKTFIQEGRWKKALDEKPDYVLIQFGHNDSHERSRPEATEAATDYSAYLRRYIDEARASGAKPVLITPMVRRTFGADGKLRDILQPYADAMKAVAAEKRAAWVDLHASSKKLVEQLGPEAAAGMANRAGDATHFNEKGARDMAELVMKELAAAEPGLNALLKAP